MAVLRRLRRRGKCESSVAMVRVTRLINLEVCLWRLLVIDLLPVRNGCSLLTVVIKVL